MVETPADSRNLFETLLSDGRPLLAALALALIAAGATALLLASTDRFLPHDSDYLGMTAQELCAHHGCRIVHFMAHDRASFGGVVLAIGLIYLWLVTFPLADRQKWAWWTIAISGAIGFASFLTYIGHGYVDSWHLTATLVILPLFVVGLGRSRSTTIARNPNRTAIGLGRSCLLAATVGATGAGVVIAGIGTTAVFVPQDLEYMGVDVAELHSLNPRLVPLIAHDRAGFGGALVSAGVATSLCVWFGASRSLWQALVLVGVAGFGPAIGVHFMIGYTDPLHLAPAVGGSAIYAVGLALTYRTMARRGGARS